MRRILTTVTAALLLPASLLLVQTPARATGALVDPDDVYVSNFEGWGTALAWGANVVGGWSDTNRNKIADLLFSPSGLGLNVVRYHIGAGQDPNYADLGCAAQRPGSPLPTYETSAGTYDWTADANQRWFAQAAKARGANKWLAYASSPPYWMTINGCSNGGDGGGQNLKGYWGYDGDGTGAYNGTTSYSNNTDDSVTIAFTGTQIAFYAAKSADSGKAGISIDGGAETVVDLYSASRQANQLVYTSPTLASGSHTLKVRVTGTKQAASSGYFVSPDRVLVNGVTSIDDQTRGTGQNQFNYHWNAYEPFADYLTEVVKHFHDSWGITFDLLDPLNEPDASWWTKTTRQEGAHFDPHSQDELITRVGQSLAAKGLTGTTVAAPDADTVANGVSSFNSYSAAAKSYVSTINTHTYITSPADQVNLRTTAATAGKKLWMSEYGAGESAFGVSPGAYSDPTKAQPAINLGAEITTDLTNLRPSAWVQWDGIESWEENDSATMSWGLIWGKYLDNTQTWTVAKQYYGYGNYTRFIRPGYRIIASNDSNTVAAYDPASQKVVLVVYNDSDSSRWVDYDLTKFGAIPAATPYRTSDTESLAQLPDVAMTGNHLTTTLAPKSVTTFVMPGSTTINDRDTGTGRNQFEYAGSWSNGSQSGAYLGDNSWSGSTNAAYNVHLNGTQIDLYGATAPNHGIAAVSIDGGAETNVDFYSPTRADDVLVYRSPGLSAGNHVLKVRVTGTKNALSSGVTIPADRADVTQPGGTRVNDSVTGTGTNQFDYNTTWGSAGQSGAWLGDNHWSGTSNDNYQVRFNGTKVDLYGAKAPNQGIAAISVDGGPETLVDLYRASRIDDLLLWSSPVLTSGAHTLKVRVTGTKNAASSGVYIPADRVDVFG